MEIKEGVPGAGRRGRNGSPRPGKGDHILEQMKHGFAGLSESPWSGTCPEESVTIGIREYREIFFKPYRIVYRIVAENVYVMEIADGRRELQTRLQRRLPHA